jgi:hypothetical protein
VATATGAYATAALFKELAGTTSAEDDTLIGKLCDRTNQVLESEMGQVVAPITSAAYLYDGNGLKHLYLPLPPASLPGIGGIRAASLVEVASETGGTFETIASTDYFLRGHAPGPGSPYRWLVLSDIPAGSYTVWPEGYANVRVTGTASWTAIPDDLTQLALAVVQRAWNARQTGYQNVDGVDEQGRPIVGRFLALPDYRTLKRYKVSQEQVRG